MITLTRMNVSMRGYNKCDEHSISLSGVGEDTINHIIERTRTTKRAPNAISFGVYEAGEMSGTSWQSATALMLHYRIGSDRDGAVAQLVDAASQLRVGHFIIEACERDGTRTLALVIPLLTRINKDRYARLVGVIFDEMKACGCQLRAAEGMSAMTHQIHLHQQSEAVWMPGPALDGLAKIKATKTASQNLDYSRMTGAAAEAQLDKPTLTACDDGLFEW